MWGAFFDFMLEIVDLCFQSRGFGPVSLCLEAGQIVWLCGPSGSGKSTLCRLLLGDLDATQGAVRWPEEVSCGYMSGDVESQLLGSTVAQELEFARRAGREESVSACWSGLQSEVEGRFQGRLGVDPHGLSRGEQQLLLLASLVMGPYSCLVLDEGLSGLDEAAFRAFSDSLRRVADAGGLVIIVSHEARVARLADRVVGLSEGKVSLCCSASQLKWRDLMDLKLWTGAEVVGPAEEAVLSGSRRLFDSNSRLAGRSKGETLYLPRPWELSLKDGQSVAVAGVSGSGKARLLRELFFSPLLSESYRVMLTDRPTAMLRGRTVRAELAMSSNVGAARGGSALAWEIPDDWLDRPPRALSTGQQKLLTCRCLLLQRPALLLLEDPFSGLDCQLRERLEAWLCEYLDNGGRLLFTTHSPDEIALYPELVALVEHDALVWVGPNKAALFEQPAAVRLGRPGFLSVS